MISHLCFCFDEKAKETSVIGKFFRLPCVKGAVGASRLRDCFFTTLQPLRGFRTRLGDACKHASHTCKSLTQGRLIQPSPVGEGGSRRLSDEVFFCKRNFNNCFIQTLQLKNRGDFSSLFFYQFAALPHLFSSIFSLISAQRSVSRQSIMQISPPLPSFTILPSVSESFALASSGICESFVCSPSFTSS